MTLSKLLEGISVTKLFQTVFGQMVVTQEIEVRRIQHDSRKVEQGDAFVAIRGAEVDGHKFIDDAVHRGAKVVVLEDDKALPDSFFMHAGVVKIVVQDARKALAKMSANYFENPAGKLQLIGVTGTNGKTTTSYLISSIIEKAGLIGTIEYKIGDKLIPATHTTPESLALNELLARMVENGCKAAVMEVSSHALHQHRVNGLEFDAAVFTNLTQDHLDYHGTMDQYFRAKKTLFDSLRGSAVAVTNIDDAYGLRVTESCKARTISYGVHPHADVRAEDIKLSTAGTRFRIVHQGEATEVESPLIGRFNVYNIIAAFSTGLALGISRERLQTGIARFQSVRGRFERVVSPNGWTVIIDYAHTPDALENCMKAIHDIFDSGDSSPGKRGRIITVFGCGGNRDRGKRPLMGRIATERGDITIVTSDNPRIEDPERIISEVMMGVLPDAPVYREADRGKAIERALQLAQPGDVVLIAGKGHETYQVVGREQLPFNDREVVEKFIRS